MVDARDSQSDQAGTTSRHPHCAPVLRLTSLRAKPTTMRLVHRSSVGILALALAATGLVLTAGGTSAGRGSIPRSSATAAVISKHPVVTGLSHQTNAVVRATGRNTTAAVATAPVATPVSTTSTTTAPQPAPAPAPAPAPSVPTPAPIAPAAPPAVSPTTESLVATLVAQVTASGIDPGSNWSWSMGNTSTHCSVMTGTGTGCTYGAGGQEFTVFAGTPNLALVAHELANAETQNDAVPSLMDQVSAAEGGTSWSPTDAVATCLVAHFMGFQDGAAGTWQCPTDLGTIVADDIHV
jgi:hypothetical protein